MYVSRRNGFARSGKTLIGDTMNERKKEKMRLSLPGPSWGEGEDNVEKRIILYFKILVARLDHEGRARFRDAHHSEARSGHHEAAIADHDDISGPI